MKAIIILLFCIGAPVLSQTVIKLKKPQQPRHEYLYVNPLDTQFVSVWHLEDMGQWGSRYFNLKLNIPDGAYNVYIDNDLVLIGFMKNGLQDSIWSHFLNSKLSTTTTYLNGKKVEEINYYDSGKIGNRGLYENGQWVSDINYYESGCIMTKLTRNGNESIKEEFPDCLNKKSENDSLYIDSINLNYQIKIFPYGNGVIRYNLQPTVINDTSFFYYDSKKLFSKGQLVRRRVKCRKLSFESKQFINSRNEYHEAACTKLYKIGNWTFYEEGGNLLLECSYIKYRKITVPNGKWKYYKDNNVYKIEKYKNGELELVSFDSKDF